MGNQEKFASGRTIADLIENHRIPANIATYILAECAKTLKDAAQQGRLHQNIKPAHILVSSTGRVQLTKFNADAGKSAPVSFLKSALPYVAPELHAGATPSVSSDIFALGSTFYEILVGDTAFKGASGKEVKDRVLNYDPTPQLHEEDHVHTQLRRICQQMLRKKPEQRYQGYNVLLADLEAYKKNRGIEAVGSAIEMKRFFGNPDGYVSPEKTHAKGAGGLRSRSGGASRRSAKSAPAKKAAKQPQLSRWFITVGLIVVLFSGLSLAGNFFFSKDGKWGGNGTGPGASSPSDRSSSTVTTRKGRGQGNAAVQASGSSKTQQNTSLATVQGESDPVEILDQSGEEQSNEGQENTALNAVSLAGVDTVIILPNEEDARSGRLLVNSDPKAAVLFLGDSLGTTPLPVVTHPGTYSIKLVAPGFPVFETQVDVIPDREVPLNVSLWFLVGRLDLEVEPAAEVWINNQFIGASISKKSIPLSSGTHRLKLVHPDYGTFEPDIEITTGDQRVARFDLAEMQ